MEVKFVKMHGAGNDFIVVDEFNGIIVPEEKKRGFARKISDRHFGAGSDGVIFIQKSGKADLNFVFYNPDGSRAEMCGNGIRCLAKYAYEHGLVKKENMVVETLAGLRKLDLTIEDGIISSVKVDMGAPQVRRGEAQVNGDPESMMVNEEVVVDDESYRVTSVGMGNPHAILFTENIADVDVREVGSKIRYSTQLFPKGTNVHFIQRAGKNEFKIRTYERGVEDETLACGTGICASAVAAVLNKKADPNKPIVFHARGGILKVDLKTIGGEVKEVFLTGPVETVFEGVYEYR